MTPYRERVPSSTPFILALRLAALTLIVLGVAGAIALDTSTGERIIFLIAMLATGLILLVTFEVFGALSVTVEDDVRVRFGPFTKRLAAGRLRSVQVESYRWMRYGGWGIRYGLGGRRAWSVPFVGAGVEVALKDGPMYFISSHRPDDLRQAVERLIEDRGGARG